MSVNYKMMVLFLLSGFLGLCADTIVPDRPGFSTGTYTVQPGKLNVEIGYNYTKTDETLPLMVLRTGITEKLEFNLMYDGLDFKHSDQGSYTWSSDLIVGVKYRLYESDLYNFTFMGYTSLPVDNTQDISSESMTPLVAFLWDYTLSDTVGLCGTLQGSTYYDNERVYDFQPAVGISFAHTDKFSSYLELYSIIPSSTAQRGENVLDGALIYLLSDDVQIDINAGLGLDKYSDDFVGFGVAVQF